VKVDNTMIYYDVNDDTFISHMTLTRDTRMSACIGLS